MTGREIDEFVLRAESIYADRLQNVLEAEHLHEFVAIEPDSGDYFLGQTLSQAMGAARRSHPDKLAHAIRIGHKAALHFGIHVA